MKVMKAVTHTENVRRLYDIKTQSPSN